MMKKAVFAIVAVSLVGYGVYRGSAHKPKGDASLVTNRVWIDHIPRSERDVIQIFAAISDHSIGVFQAASAWKGQYEGFRYESNGDEFRLVFPQNGDRERVMMKATRCDEGGMDFCMQVTGSSRGAKRYFSRKGWEIDSINDLDSARERLR